MWESDIIAWRGCHNPHQILKRPLTLARRVDLSYDSGQSMLEFIGGSR